MTKKLIILKKLIAIYIALLLAINPLFIRLVWAEESPEILSPEPTATELEITGEPSEASDVPATEEQASEEEQGEGEIIVDTGDGLALTDVETDANNNNVVLEGELTVPSDPCKSPGLTTDCPDGLKVELLNEAELDLEATSSAGTGDNNIEADGADATTNTGDAIAGTDASNQVNTNKLELLDEEENKAENTDQDKEAPKDGPWVEVDITNEGSINNLVCSDADTGDNTTAGGGDVIINTGDAVAWINLINYLNTNFIGSRIEFLFLDVIEEDFLNGNLEINLNEVWRELLAQNTESETDPLADEDFLQMDAIIRNLNNAELTNDVFVSAETGQNEASNSGDVDINTGDATALANVFNLVNVNVLGSDLLFFTINIFGSFAGDLVLPRPENFTSTNETEGDAEGSDTVLALSYDNEATLDNNLQVEAETGENSSKDNEGMVDINTGDAQAIANILSLVNINISGNDWFYLIINTIGNWTGSILGWSSPEASESHDGETNTYQTGLEQNNNSSSNNSEPDSLMSVTSTNSADIDNNINVRASTGENEAANNEGDVSIKTGTATALANLFNLVNLNIMGGRLFFGSLNIFGNWTGNLIFAYPDVTVDLHNGNGELKPGDITSYTLTYQNNGYDLAEEVQLQMQLPNGMSFLSQSSDLLFSLDNNNCVWQIDNLNVNEGGVIKIFVQVDPDFSFDEEPSLTQLLVRSAHAAEARAEKEIITTASIGTIIPESNSGNNNVQVATIIYSDNDNNNGSEGSDADDGEDDEKGIPVLVLSANNNVNEYVYPGDVVTFEISVRNTGDGRSYETNILQSLYNGNPDMDLGTAEFPIGTIEPGKKVTIRFGMKLGDNGILENSSYYTIAQAVGQAPSGDEVFSNEARTDFDIHLKYMVLLDVQAKEEDSDILGLQDELADETCPEPAKDNILPYVLLFLSSSFYLIHRLRELRINKFKK